MPNPNSLFCALTLALCATATPLVAQDSVTVPGAPTTPTATAPSPAPVAPAPTQALPTLQVPDSISPQLIGRLVGIWQGMQENKELRMRETTQLELRPDGVSVATLRVQSPTTQKEREPVVATHRWTVAAVSNATYTVDFEYTGGDPEVEAPDALRRVQLTLLADGSLRSNDGSVFTRVR